LKNKLKTSVVALLAVGLLAGCNNKQSSNSKPTANQSETVTKTNKNVVNSVDDLKNTKQTYIDQNDNHYKLITKGTIKDMSSGGLVLNHITYQIIAINNLPKYPNVPGDYLIPENTKLPNKGSVAFLKINSNIKNQTNDTLQIDGGLITSSYSTPDNEQKDIDTTGTVSTSAQKIKGQAHKKVLDTLFLSSAKNFKDLKKTIQNGDYKFESGQILKIVDEDNEEAGKPLNFTVTVNK
jgi:anti-sigma28 factor (negative regulator of flagellin synthesis)